MVGFEGKIMLVILKNNIVVHFKQTAFLKEKAADWKMVSELTVSVSWNELQFQALQPVQ